MARLQLVSTSVSILPVFLQLSERHLLLVLGWGHSCRRLERENEIIGDMDLGQCIQIQHHGLILIRRR